jgi:general secretion pathway protein I
VSGRRRQRGFTLLEVLVALAILSLAVVAAIQAFAQGLRLLKLSSDHQEAMALADQKARETLSPVAGREEGTEGAFHWERTTKAVEAPDLQPAGAATPRWHVYEIMVRVTWGGGRRVEVTTLRTVSAAAEAAERAQPGRPSGEGSTR